jgi:hypothetical protein
MVCRFKVHLTSRQEHLPTVVNETTRSTSESLYRAVPFYRKEHVAMFTMDARDITTPTLILRPNHSGSLVSRQSLHDVCMNM